MFSNIPLLLQILFWYLSAIVLLPGVGDTLQFGSVLLNNRGLFLPSIHLDTAGAWPFVLDRPHVDGFDVAGGFAILPELMALTLGLSIYNSTFLAEIFRAGILSVPRGQIEAAATVGLSGARAALLVTLPQALRVALPAAGGQYQTLAKASSLAAAIGYPDIMQIVGGTVASQTSQALEAMALVVLLYAAINLLIAVGGECGESTLAEARGPRGMTAHHVSPALIVARTCTRCADVCRSTLAARVVPDPGDGRAVAGLLVLFAVSGWNLFEWAVVNAHWRGTSSAACPGDIGACWAFVVARWKPWLVGNYPAGELWRAWTCFGAFALFWTWVVRRSHAASLQRVLLGFVLLPVALCLLLIGRWAAAVRRAHAAGAGCC